MLRLKCFLLGLVANALAKMEGFIVGGNMASFEKHAYSAYISVSCIDKDGEQSVFSCGSSIINQFILLSAAHCFYECTKESFISLKIGSASLSESLLHRTRSYVLHEQYNQRTSDNDISLLRVENRIKLGRSSSRVALMRKPPYSELAYVAGWGVTDELLATVSDQLKYTSQKVLPKSSCLQIFKTLAKGSFCAANDNKWEYASLGDSGSALVVRGFIQIGVVSYKIPAASRHVVIYTDVGHYFDWITSYARALTCYGY